MKKKENEYLGDSILFGLLVVAFAINPIFAVSGFILLMICWPKIKD